MGTASKLALVIALTILLLPCFTTVTTTRLTSPVNEASVLSEYQLGLSTSSKASSVPISVNWSSYHDYTSLVNLLRSFNESYPGVADVFSLGKTWQGRDVFCIRITDESIVNASKVQILVVAEHHAREVITQEAALYLAWYLLTNYQTDSSIQKLLAAKEIYIIPCLNPDGMQVALTYNPFQRKNMHPIDDDHDGLMDEDTIMDSNGTGRLECYEIDTNLGTTSNPAWVTTDQAYEGNDTNGNGIFPHFIGDNPGGVDLNRNYDFHFNDTFELSSNSTNPRVEDYKGSAPFSEPETRAIKGLVESHKFIFAISLHSGTEAILRPWSFTTDASSLRANLSLFNMFGEAFQQSGGLEYTGNIGYNSSGEFSDWMYGAKGIPTMTCEIYGNSSAYGVTWSTSQGDRYVWYGVWDYFNPPNQLIEMVCSRTLWLLKEVCSISNYSSVRITSDSGQPSVFKDGSNQLNLSWNFGVPSDIAVGSYTLLPSELYWGQQPAPMGDFSLLSDHNLTDPKLSIRYNDQQLNLNSSYENSLTVFVWNWQDDKWLPLQPLERDTEKNTIMVALAPTIISNVVYYFVLASYSSFGFPQQVIVLLAVAIGITGGIAVIVWHRIGKGQKGPVPEQIAPLKTLHEIREVL
jgi:hypothetical protein